MFDDNESPYDDAERVDEHDWDIDDTLYSIVGGVVIVESEGEGEDGGEGGN